MSDQNQNLGAGLPPDTLLKLLEAARKALPPGDRYREAGALAWKIIRLRQEREELGFELVSLKAYLTQLAERAKIDLQSVLDYYGVHQLTLETSARSLCKLAQDLGSSVKELYLQCARWQADTEGLPWPIALGGGTPDNRDCLDQYISAVENLKWEAEARARLNRMRREIYREYGEPDS